MEDNEVKPIIRRKIDESIAMDTRTRKVMNIQSRNTVYQKT